MANKIQIVGENDLGQCSVTDIDYARYASAPVGYRWIESGDAPGATKINNESATVIYRDVRGIIILHERWGIDNGKDWAAEPMPYWMPLL